MSFPEGTRRARARLAAAHAAQVVVDGPLGRGRTTNRRHAVGHGQNETEEKGAGDDEEAHVEMYQV